MTYEKIAKRQAYLSQKRKELKNIECIYKANNRLVRIIRLNNLVMEQLVELNQKEMSDILNLSMRFYLDGEI